MRDLAILYIENPITMGAITATLLLIVAAIVLTGLWRPLLYVVIVVGTAAAWYFICRHFGIIEGLS